VDSVLVKHPRFITTVEITCTDTGCAYREERAATLPWMARIEYELWTRAAGHRGVGNEKDFCTGLPQGRVSIYERIGASNTRGPQVRTASATQGFAIRTLLDLLDGLRHGVAAWL
jgi:hypothetical protein